MCNATPPPPLSISALLHPSDKEHMFQYWYGGPTTRQTTFFNGDGAVNIFALRHAIQG